MLKIDTAYNSGYEARKCSPKLSYAQLLISANVRRNFQPIKKGIIKMLNKRIMDIYKEKTGMEAIYKNDNAATYHYLGYVSWLEDELERCMSIKEKTSAVENIA